MADESELLEHHLRRDMLVAIADGAGAPVGLRVPLTRAAQAVGGVRVLLGWTLAMPVDAEQRTAYRDVLSLMSGYALRGPIRAGDVRYVPARLGTVPTLVAGPLRPDVLVAALRPGPRGLVFGSEVSWMRAAVDAGALVLAEVNHGLPAASDGTPVPAERVVVVAETDRMPISLPVGEPDDVATAIGERVAALIPAGATVQYGPGPLTDAALRSIGVPVAIDSGLVTDAVMDLEARGLVLGRPRGTYVAGTDALYAWADGRHLVDGLEVTHDIGRLAAHDCFVALNTALEIDSVGQVNIERVDSDPVGSIGGHADFALAASRSRHGLSIVAVPSAHRRGPTLVDRLTAPVTTPRSDIDVVVTEHGSADLRGLDDPSRERALHALWDRAP